MKLLNYLKLALPILVIGLCFSSCSKEDIDTTPTVRPTENIDANLIDDIIEKNNIGVFASVSSCDCYGPFENIDWENLEDEEIVAQVEAAIAAMTEEELAELFTPVCADGIFYANACFAECEGITSFDDCYEGEWDDEWEIDLDDEWGCDFASLEFLNCYELQFPVSIVFEDGSTVEINDMNQFFETIIIAEEESPELAYPFTLTHFETGVVETITSDEELAALSIDCFDVSGGDPNGGGTGTGGPQDDCIVDSFPMTILIDGDAVTLQTPEEFEELINDILMDNPNPDEVFESFELGYPTTLTFESGDQVIINSEEEYFEAVLEYCP